MNFKDLTIWAVVAILGISIGILWPFEDTTKPKDKVSIAIEFEPNADQNMLVITAPAKDNCKSKGSKTGCFKIRKSKTGLVKFKFTAPMPWELKQFTICQGTAKITTSCAADLTLDERLEFFIMDDESGSTILLTPENGMIKLSSLPKGAELREFFLLDQNTIKQDFFYNIQACNGANCITLDPPVENKGRN